MCAPVLQIVMEKMSHTLESLLPGSTFLTEQLELFGEGSEGNSAGSGTGKNVGEDQFSFPQDNHEKLEKFLSGIIKQVFMCPCTTMYLRYDLIVVLTWIG